MNMDIEIFKKDTMKNHDLNWHLQNLLFARLNFQRSSQKDVLNSKKVAIFCWLMYILTHFLFIEEPFKMLGQWLFVTDFIIIYK